MFESLSRVQPYGTSWTVARQAPLSMESSKQVYWRGLPCSPPGGSSWPMDRPRVSPVAGRFFTVWTTREAKNPSNLFCKRNFTLPVVKLSQDKCVGAIGCIVVTKRDTLSPGCAVPCRSVMSDSLYPGLPHCRRILYHLSHQGPQDGLQTGSCQSQGSHTSPPSKTFYRPHLDN